MVVGDKNKMFHLDLRSRSSRVQLGVYSVLGYQEKQGGSVANSSSLKRVVAVATTSFIAAHTC